MLLSGVRCSVRPWKQSDAPSLVRHADNLNVARYLRDVFPHPYTRADARTFLRRAVTAQDPTNMAIDVEGQAVGAIGYVPGRDVERYSAEIGYWLGEELWGRGIVTEAIRLVTAHAFTQLDFLRLFALPFADNPGSARVLEKAGYSQEAVLRSSSVKYGEAKDQLLYAKINPEWRPRSL
ncbi:MAG: GNAT family N-acetyltransferase [Acidobacteria bacterium]|nr:GNAT family N-acetyltransferase [Acidobacteriota bacterium]